MRLPHGRSREVLDEMVGLWGELSAVEGGQHLSFLREPDLGFAWTVHAWARGTSLEKLVGAELTAGDFVRAVKQLIDLLSQIAVVARGDELAADRASGDRPAAPRRSRVLVGGLAARQDKARRSGPRPARKTELRLHPRMADAR